MIEPMKYKKKPVVIEAVQLTDPNTPEEIAKWCGGQVKWLPYISGESACCIVIGEMKASFMDWIIKGTHGEFYPCKPAIFAETYEKVEEAEGIQSMNNIISQLDEIRKRHDPLVQNGKHGDRCELCNYVRHPCDAFEAAYEGIKEIVRLENGQDAIHRIANDYRPTPCRGGCKKERLNHIPDIKKKVETKGENQ